MFKGYNIHYASFSHLHEAITEESIKAYGRDYFETWQLHHFPPLIMVFSPEPLKTLAKETNPVKGSLPSYQHLYKTTLEQVESFVGIGDRPYDFILEIAHSGLGLRYDIEGNTAKNPINGVNIVDKEVIYDARVDRAMIDVSLELRRRYPNRLRFSSCTRLPDVILPTGKFKARYESSKLDGWAIGEKAISSELKAIHGGLYPQSNIAICDDPLAEIAARTWIDQEAGLDRRELFHVSYEDWLRRANKKGLVEALRTINGDFMPNRIEGSADYGGAENQQFGRSGSVHDHDLFSKRKTNFGREGTKDYDPRVAVTDSMGGMRIYPSGPNDKRRILRQENEEFVFNNVTDTIRERNSLYLYAQIDYGNLHSNFEGLIRYGADINALTGRYGTPLALACMRGYDLIVPTLLRNQADVGVKGPLGYPLELASDNGHEKVVRQLLVHMDNHDSIRGTAAKKESFYAAFYAACGQKSTSVIQMLFEESRQAIGEECNVNCLRGSLRTPLSMACAAGHEAVVRLLLNRGARVNTGFSPPLYWACLYGHRGVVQLLVGAGCNVNAIGEIDGAMSSVTLGRGRGTMIKKRARVDDRWKISTSGARTALGAACAEGHEIIVELLLQAGAKIDLVPKNGASALYWACANGHESVVRLLLSRTASVNKHEAYATSALNGACISGHLNIVKILLERGAKLELPKKTFYPSHICAWLVDQGEYLHNQEGHSRFPNKDYHSSYQSRPKQVAGKPDPPESRWDTYRRYAWACADDAPVVLPDCGCPICSIDQYTTGRAPKTPSHPDMSEEIVWGSDEDEGEEDYHEPFQSHGAKIPSGRLFHFLAGTNFPWSESRALPQDHIPLFGVVPPSQLDNQHDVDRSADMTENQVTSQVTDSRGETPSQRRNIWWSLDHVADEWHNGSKARVLRYYILPCLGVVMVIVVVCLVVWAIKRRPKG